MKSLPTSKRPPSRPPPWQGEEQSAAPLQSMEICEIAASRSQKNQTEPEKRFWSWVRAKQLGVKFRRQHGLGKHILNFYCAELNLMVELDGDSHFTPEGIANDAIRSQFINSYSSTIIRFTNKQIMHEKEGVLISLLNLIQKSKSSS